MEGNKINMTAYAGEALTRGLAILLAKNATTDTIPEATLAVASKRVDGIVDRAEEPTAAGQNVNICLHGVCEAVSGAALKIGDKVRSDAASKSVHAHNTVTSGSSTTELIVESQRDFDGDEGTDITITLTDPSGNDQTLAITVVGHDIDVSLATGPAGAITSTPAEIAAGILAEAAAANLVFSDSAGDGAVSAVAKAYLTGGQGAYGIALQKAAAADEFFTVLKGGV